MDGFLTTPARRSASLSVLFGALALTGCGASDGTASPGSAGASAGNPSAGAAPVAAGMGGMNATGGTGVGGTTPSAGGSGPGLAGAGGVATVGAGGAVAGAGGSTVNGDAGGGTAGAAGGGGKTAVCNFASGLNVAWVSFANDIPSPDLPTFKTIFKNNYDAGGRVVRWWFHTNGTHTPGYDGDGKALAIQQSHIDGVKALLQAADDAGVALVISLWSFDMLHTSAGATYTNNQALLEKDENRQAYIDRYLTPLVTALKGTKGLYAYEIFNEPEGMGPNGWADHRTTLAAIQKTVNWFTAAIHTADPNVLVTTSAQTFDTCSKISGKTNLYSDDALRTAGGKQNGTLDFYQVHYYESNGISNSAFQHPASYWGLDKKLVMGEFYPDDTDGVAAKDLGKYLYENGYNGAWYWSTTDRKWPLGQSTLQTLYAAHADVANCPIK
ncbi:MAG: cellulase family glycosylhydrolase [Pseudomonadota bacterium]